MDVERERLYAEVSRKSVMGAKEIAMRLEELGYLPYECLFASAVFINIGLEALGKIATEKEVKDLKKTVIDIIEIDTGKL